MKIIPLLIALFTMGCTTQYTVINNEIIQNKNHKYGIKSSTGKILMDTIYTSITVLHHNSKQTLPPKSRRETPQPIEYYLVTNENNFKGIFNSNGKQVFDFTDCITIQFDEYTQTVVVIKETDGNHHRSSLYKINNQLLFEETFETIGYISHSDLIALIVEDGANEEYYLFNPFTNIKLGPYTHFNIFNEDRSPLLGMNENDFEIYKTLNFITVRTEKDNDYIWGIVDMKGNELLPVQYEYFRVIDKSMKEQHIGRSEKPEGVDFIFYSRRIDEQSTLLFFDRQLNEYEYEISKDYKSTIKKRE